MAAAVIEIAPPATRCRLCGCEPAEWSAVTFSDTYKACSDIAACVARWEMAHGFRYGTFGGLHERTGTGEAPAETVAVEGEVL